MRIVCLSQVNKEHIVFPHNDIWLNHSVFCVHIAHLIRIGSKVINRENAFGFLLR